jgi:hypothetical protein
MDGMEKEEVLEFVKGMRPTDHVILFYSHPDDKQLVLFTYLKAGLDEGEAAAYVGTQEPPNEVRAAMKRFGIDVDPLERIGGLRIMPYTDWYFKEGTFNIPRTMKLWRDLYDEVTAKGFKGLRVTGETACFFQKGKVKELLEYERALHRVLEFPMTAICAYDSNLTTGEATPELYLNLIKSHSTVIFAGPQGAVVKSY